jgi:predicted 2-oxoglutarate/Fe(II)-dependent dioxygenase YbiX
MNRLIAPLLPGRRPEFFQAVTHMRPDFAFGSLGGWYTVMLFLPEAADRAAAALSTLRAERALFDDEDRVAFTVTRSEAAFRALEPELPGIRHFHDPDGSIADRFGVRAADGGTLGHWFLLDPSLRVVLAAPLEKSQAIFDRLRVAGPAENYAGVPIHAPVLIVPRVFEPELCRTLIDVYRADGGGPSGVMREINGMTVGVLDNFKKRRDATITDGALQKTIQNRVFHNLLPEIERAFSFRATRMERYIVACYSAEDGGYFRAHRDNTSKGTAHRRFACSINLNAEEFEGGDLRFAEFGRRTYRPPTGGAVIFSCSLLHEATPVTRGTRYAFLPFFYDDAAAKIREANARYIIPQGSDHVPSPVPDEPTGTRAASV